MISKAAFFIIAMFLVPIGLILYSFDDYWSAFIIGVSTGIFFGISSKEAEQKE